MPWAEKRALVVDDSKSARVILSRMLEKYDIEVDMAESAEQAIEYLQHDRPDAIFMDHLMPGMDGLQAVQTIKGNPQTAMIPIMMYTSQEGELYVGQARALGAMGVLPKQVGRSMYRRCCTSCICCRIGAIWTSPRLYRWNSEAAAPAPAATGLRRARRRPWGTGDDASRPPSNSNPSTCAASSSRASTASPLGWWPICAARPRRQPLSREPLPPPKHPPMWPWAAGIGAACLVAVACALFWATSRVDLAKARTELAALRAANADLQRTREQLAATVKDLERRGRGERGECVGRNDFRRRACRRCGAGCRASEPVPYGELPFDRSRARRTARCADEARGAGISRGGQGHELGGNVLPQPAMPTDGFAPASASLPASKCDLVGNPFEESLSGQQRQSIAFANLVAGVRQRTSGAITVALENAGSSRAAAPYPPRNESLTAGEWNRAAAANNRVEFAVEPNVSQ